MLSPLLIIANSGRMLAQAARNSGFTPLVIDCYGDQDTRQLATAFVQVASLSVNELRPVLSFFKQKYDVNYLIYGSGFESEPESLFFLAQQFEILGNPPETFLAVQNRHRFFQHLTELAIPYPEVSFNQPQNRGNWLFKPQHSQGGMGIHFCRSDLSRPYKNKSKPENKTSGYYQRYLNGKPLSALFLANGKQVQIIGFNRQWTIQLDKQPFVFSGIINQVELSPIQQQTLLNWLNSLVAVYKLRGLNSLDFILYENGCYVLEINARPPASMQLYESDLLAAHIDACYGHLDLPGFKNLEGLADYKAYQIIYAPKPVLITDDINWPAGCVDIPASNVIISTGQPICSMIAAACKPQQVFADLQHKQQLLLSHLYTTNHDGIYSKR